ncbi:MAG: GNAT family N-acetyltransferase [Undibacterium sp.]|nr:GNAT family N-acetyltransferase [Undibacterium sp.]
MSTTINRVIADANSAQITVSKVVPYSTISLVDIDKANDVSVSCYDDVPEFVESELVRLYGNFYSSLSHLRELKNFDCVNTYVERFKGNIISLILFQREKSVVTVFNEVIAISDNEVERFSRYIFDHFNEVAVIKFRAISTEMDHFVFPFQRYNYLEDIVIDLPQDTQLYLASLGKNLRRNLKRCQKKLEIEHPSFSFRMSLDGSVKEQDIHDVVALNRTRMLEKNKVPAIDEEETELLVTQVRESGLVCIATVDDHVCAGAICFRTGKNYFLTVIAHDSNYDVYSLGMLCCAHMICECIDRGGNEFHFLWGRYDYKFALNGIQRDLFQVVIYRSKFQFLMHLKLALIIWKRAKTRQAVLYLQQIKKSNGLMSRLAMQFLSAIRRI